MNQLIVLLLIVVFFVILFFSLAAKGSSAGPAEKYGPPPGRARALDPRELGDRGWPSMDKAYQGDSASSVAHVVLRSA